MKLISFSVVHYYVRLTLMGAYAITAYEIQVTLFKYGSCDCGVVSTLRGLLLAIYDYKLVLTFLN